MSYVQIKQSLVLSVTKVNINILKLFLSTFLNFDKIVTGAII